MEDLPETLEEAVDRIITAADAAAHLIMSRMLELNHEEI